MLEIANLTLAIVLSLYKEKFLSAQAVTKSALFFALIENMIHLDYSTRKVDLPIHRKKIGNVLKKKYDFIVVGGGLSGCILASRLSKHFNTLLLEGGSTPTDIAAVPGLELFGAVDPRIVTQYVSTPQVKADLRLLYLGVGTSLSGQQTMNANVWNRGSPKDYESFAKITNNPSLKYKNVAKVFKKIENYTGIWSNSGKRGTNGPLNVITFLPPSQSVFEAAVNELKYKIYDGNGDQRPGDYSWYDYTVRNGLRDSTYTAYLIPYLGIRKKLQLYKNSKVNEILFKQNKAIGVSFEKNGKTYKAYAKFEIILSAGVFGTPQLLWKSGIGPKLMLELAGIKVKQDMPEVGQNLKAPPYVTLHYAIKKPNGIFRRFENLESKDIDSFILHQTGLLELNYYLFQKFYKSSFASKTSGPDMQLSYETPPPESQTPNFGFGPEVNFTDTEILSVRSVLGRPKSTGSISLDTEAYLAGIRDPLLLSKIDVSFGSNEDDINALVEGLNEANKLINTSAFQNLEPSLLIPPACKLPTGGDELWKCLIRTQGNIASFYATSTCRMGSDKESIVDNQFRVNGFKNLRIIDASVLPHTTNSQNANAPIAVLTEIGVQTVLNDYSAGATKKLYCKACKLK